MAIKSVVSEKKMLVTWDNSSLLLIVLAASSADYPVAGYLIRASSGDNGYVVC